MRGYAGFATGEAGPATDKLLSQADTLERRGQDDYDIDFGLLVGSPALTIGLVARNMREPSFTSSQGARSDLSGRFAGLFCVTGHCVERRGG